MELDLYEEVSPHETLAQPNSRQTRVDPRYPLYYQNGRESQANGQTVASEDMARRTTSRRRKPSGSGGSSIPLPVPAAPEVPRSSRGGPPVSYRHPFGGDIPIVPEPTGKSFSERAAAQPNAFDTTFAAYHTPDSLPQGEGRRHSRRISTGHEAPVTYPTIPKQQERRYSTREETDVAPRVGQVPRANPQVRDPHQRTGSREQEGRRASSSQPRRADTIHSSTGEPSDWAAEKSPLQKLEYKLNDISKEEKRARVMQAEAKLRESKSGGSSRRVSEAMDQSLGRSASKRISSAEAPRRSSQAGGAPTGRQVSGQMETPYVTTGRSGSVRDPKIEGRRSISGTGPSKPQKSPQVGADRSDYSPPRESADLGRNDSRAVRFDGPGAVVTDAQLQGSNRGPPNSQREMLPSERAKGSKTDSRRMEELNQTPRETARVSGGGPKYHIPPQTVAGVEARRQIGFGDRQDEPTDPVDQTSHRFRDIFRKRPNQLHTAVDSSSQPRHLDEWKQGDVARLTLADANAPALDSPKINKDQAWWEGSQSGSQRRKSSITAEITAHDGAQEDSNGKESPVSSNAKSGTSFSNSLRWRAKRGQDCDQGDRREHPYIHRRNRVWFGFRPNGQPRSVAGSVNSGTTLFSSVFSSVLSSVRSTPQAGTPLPSSYEPLRHLLSQIRDPLSLHRKLTKHLSELSVPQVFTPPLYLKCGPLLRYTGLKRERQEASATNTGSFKRETWRGSILIVTDDSQSVYKPAPTLRLFHQPMSLLPPPPQQYDGSKEEELQSEYVDPVAGLPKITRTGGTVYVKPAEDLEVGKDVSAIENDDGLYEETRTANVPTSYGKADELLGRSVSSSGKGKQRSAAKVGRYKEVRGIRLHTERALTFWRFNIEIELGDKETRIAYRINQGASTGFWVPARGQSMHVMFHSCNGFSSSVNSNDFSGPDPLWRDVLNAHQLKPFHVMIGGGDQIYNDRVSNDCELFARWLEVKNPHAVHEQDFSVEMQDELEDFYLHRYCSWFSQGLFGMANSQIPMINVWDDHDIIDGFGSYDHHFMSSKIFSGLGNIAFKYYMLFQHQSVVNELESDEPSWLLGSSPGPFINELNRSVCMSLGGGIVFVGMDCRTERTKDEVLSEASYNLILDRCNREIVRGETKHLILLLGVPIAYPRLVWLENILTSRALDPLKALGRRGLLGNVMNKFDGGVEVLDDLDDHWTAKHHKTERNWFIHELQQLAAGKSVRITILSGDVHLAAVGQFYSNRNLGLPKDKDYRYMPNIISSAIVNAPPPDMLADVLNRRNKVHHLDENTDEDMIPMFTHDVDGKPRNNKRLLPKRNWCSITEYLPGSTPPSTPSDLTPTASEESLPPKSPNPIKRTLSLGRGDSKPAKLIRRLSLSNREPESYIDRPPSPDSPTREPQLVTAPIPIRPVSQFHRRPTNLSEKAAAKGGAEHDDHINLEHGLDIRINCEIKQGDPSGSTESYRLLVPALFFGRDEPDPQRPVRRPSLVQRWSSRRKNKAASAQGSGNWGQSDSESDQESNPRDSSYFGDRPDVLSQEAPVAVAPPAAASANVPKRSVSLLQPFRPRPKADPAETSVARRANFPEISAPIPLNQSPVIKGQPLRQHAPVPLAGDGEQGFDDEDDDDDDDDDEDSEDEDLYPKPQRRVGSKFDSSGVSKFFGATPGDSAGGYPQAANGSNGGGLKAKMGLGRSNSLPLPANRMSSGYDGIEAYKEKKGWRKWF